MNIPSSLITLSTLLMILRSQIYFPIPIISSKNVEQLPAETDRLAVKTVSVIQFRWRLVGLSYYIWGESKEKRKSSNTLFDFVVELTYVDRLERVTSELLFGGLYFQRGARCIGLLVKVLVWPGFTV